jgi:hypothetical protein
MTNNYCPATISPALPASLFRDEELQSLAIAIGLSAEKDGDCLYFFAEENFCDAGEDDDGEPVNCLTLMQEKLRQLDPAVYPHISIQGAAVCSKMRPDEFGGFAFFITRDDIRSVSTWQWLFEQTHGCGNSPTTES